MKYMHIQTVHVLLLPSKQLTWKQDFILVLPLYGNTQPDTSLSLSFCFMAFSWNELNKLACTS